MSARPSTSMPTDTAGKTVLVAGATGRLGGLVDVLLARGHHVRALTRDPESTSAQRLRRIGAEVLPGDFDQPESLESAAVGADAAFATGTAHQAGPEGELRHSRNLADAAVAAGVPHLVYSSGDGAAADSSLALFRAKFAVEEHIRSLPIRHTILAPVYFMENLFNPWNLSALGAGRFPSPVPIKLPFQQVAIADVVSFAALAIERPHELAGRRIELASDRLTASQAASALSAVSGRRLEAEQTSADQLPLGLRALFDWLERDGHGVDMVTLHRRHPDVGWHSYPDWARSMAPRLHKLLPAGHAHAGTSHRSPPST